MDLDRRWEDGKIEGSCRHRSPKDIRFHQHVSDRVGVELGVEHHEQTLAKNQQADFQRNSTAMYWLCLPEPPSSHADPRETITRPPQAVQCSTSSGTSCMDVHADVDVRWGASLPSIAAYLLISTRFWGNCRRATVSTYLGYL